MTGDGALILKTRAKHHAISARTKSIVEPAKERSIVVQYEVQFRKGQECGGAYLKLLASPSGSLESLNDKTQYSIMFGPDKCGNDHKVHFIFNHKNPKNGTLREIHWRKSGSVLKLDDVVKDGKWHHFRLHIRSDNSFEIQMDKKIVGKGSLLEDFSPAVNPPKEIPDVTDSKPEDWDEREKIPDPDAVKPDDWDENEPRKIPDPAASKPKDWNEDEPEMIPDPEAEKPSDWDPDMDGEWEAPLISNPKCTSLSGCGVWKAPLIDNPLYKGKWKPSLISNPNYRGKWSPRMIENPEFFEDPYPSRSLLPIDAVAFELWTISDEIAFDNILITNDVDVANHVLDLTFQPKKELADEETDSFFIRMIKYTNKKPWLWAVYVLIIALPVVLFIAYCCIEPVSKKSSAGDDELIGQRKKTDDPTPDSVQTPTLCVTPSPEEESATEPSVSPLKKFMDESKTASSAASSAKTTSKSEVTQDNDEYEEEEVEEEEIEVEEDEDVDDDQAVGADEPEEEEEVDEDNLTAGDGLKGDEPSPPRRRKTRSSKK